MTYQGCPTPRKQPVLAPDCRGLPVPYFGVPGHDPSACHSLFRQALCKTVRCPGWLLRYRKGLPPTVMKMNEECLRLRPHDHPGYQTVAEIRRIVGQAIGPLNGSQGVDSMVDGLVGDDSAYF